MQRLNMRGIKQPRDLERNVSITKKTSDGRRASCYSTMWTETRRTIPKTEAIGVSRVAHTIANSIHAQRGDSIRRVPYELRTCTHHGPRQKRCGETSSQSHYSPNTLTR